MPFSRRTSAFRRLLSLFSALVFLCTSAGALAVTNGKQAQCDVVRVAGAEEWYPFAYLQDSQPAEAKGIAHDVVRLIAQELGIKLEHMIGVPWKRIEQEMAKGNIDLLAGNYWTAERAKTWQMTEAIASETVNLYTLADKTFSFKGLTDLRGKRGVVPMGISLGQDFDTARQFLEVSEVRTHEQMYEMLQLERVNYLVSPRFAAQRIIARGLERKITKLDNPIDRYNVHLSFSRQSPCVHLNSQFNQVIHTHLQNGDIDQIIKRYVVE